VDHTLFDSDAWKCGAVAPLKEMARQQLGTVGSGNHYVDLFTDELDRVWVGVHFGSRRLGHKTATWFLKQAGASDGMDVDPCVIAADSDIGAQYIECMTLAGEYAYAGRDWARILGCDILEEVHNHHNFAWRETHGGEDLWVVRKGATPAFPGQKGFVGGTMGENSMGVNSISLKYHLARRTDQYGNVFRYAAQVNPADPTSFGKISYDIFFLILNPDGSVQTRCVPPPRHGRMGRKRSNKIADEMGPKRTCLAPSFSAAYKNKFIPNKFVVTARG